VGSLSGVMGSRNWDVRPFQVGVSEGERVAKGGMDREAEEIADPSGVTAGGLDLLEDAVSTQGLGLEICFLPRELTTDKHEAPAVFLLTNRCSLMLPGHVRPNGRATQ
jgi:hypothetical protein